MILPPARRRRCAAEKWDAKGVACPTLGYERAAALGGSASSPDPNFNHSEAELLSDTTATQTT
jgi:hypothetical protein